MPLALAGCLAVASVGLAHIRIRGFLPRGFGGAAGDGRLDTCGGDSEQVFVQNYLLVSLIIVERPVLAEARSADPSGPHILFKLQEVGVVALECVLPEPQDPHRLPVVAQQSVLHVLMCGIEVVAQVVRGGVPVVVGLDLRDLGLWQNGLAALRGDEQAVLVGGQDDAVTAVPEIVLAFKASRSLCTKDAVTMLESSQPSIAMPRTEPLRWRYG